MESLPNLSPSPSVTVTRVKNTLVVGLSMDLGLQALEQLYEQVLTQVHQQGANAIVFECSAIQYMDRYEFEKLCALFRTLTVLGSQACLAGLRPGVVKYLVLADAECSGIRAFLNLDEALAHFADHRNGDEASVDRVAEETTAGDRDAK